MSKDLRAFLAEIREMGPHYFLEVSRELEPEYEAQVLQQKLAAEGYSPAISFRVKGSSLPSVTNLCGSFEMMGAAFGLTSRDTSVNKGNGLAFHEYRQRSRDRRPTVMLPESSAPVKEVKITGKDIDLFRLPITKQAVLNSGKYISAGQLICKNPGTGIYNSGMYRQEVKSPCQLGFKPTPASHAGYIARSYGELGKKMPIVTFIGHHPATQLGSVWNGDIDTSELEVMGGYLGEPLEVTRCETVDLVVPARAEIAIEGVIDTKGVVTDGPYSEWTGYYGGYHECYIIDVTAITMRRDAIYQDLDPSSWEHNFLCMIGAQCNAYDAVKSVVPTIKSISFPRSGGGLITCYVSIKKRVPGEGKRAGWAAINSYPSIQMVVVVDDDIDVHDEEEVWWAVATRCTADTGIDIISRIAGGKLVPTSYDETRLKPGNLASKMVIDATMPVERPFATRITPPQEVWDRVQLTDYVKEYPTLAKIMRK